MKVFKQTSGWLIGMASCALLISLNSCSNNSTKLTDPEIASIAVTANQIDVDYAQIALSKSQNPVVQEFATTMAKDHKNIIDQAVALAQKLGVTPKDNPTTQSLLKGEKETSEKLNSLNGAAFDSAYIANEVAYHEAVISTVKNTLIPQAQNQELKDLLIKVSPLLEQHLQMAQSDQAKIKQGIPQLTDAEIASVAVTANQIDVRYGQLALKKSKNVEVRHFAETMIKDHSNIIKQAASLAKKLGVTPKDNAVTQSLLAGEKQVTAHINGLEGNSFDTAYINNEVSYHTAVISAVKNILVPQTQNDQLKQLLVSVSPLLSQHLQMAKDVQSKIENK